MTIKVLTYLLALILSSAAAQSVTMLDKDGRVATALTDGDLITLRAELGEPVKEATELQFTLEPDHEVASCHVSRGEASCSSRTFHALGWYWSAGEPQPERILSVAIAEDEVATLELEVSPRPVVLVHGFNASAATWRAYVGEDGFLSLLGLSGFAVGDLPEAGLLNLGSASRPRSPTLTLEENAEVLGGYIDALKRISGAQMVDLVVHSMGGLVARVYIAQVMDERDVAQLVILGTPNGGSPCARLPVSLGFAVPASLELRPNYVRNVLNPQVTERRDIPFSMMAGTPIRDAFRSPCTSTPTDLVVSRSSAGSIGQVVEMDVAHTDMTASEEVFESFVAPRLTRSPGTFEPHLDEFVPLPEAEPTQVTQTFSGTLAPGETRDLTVHLDAVLVASFALYDPALSLEVEVRGASGQVLDLQTDAAGLIELDDPDALFQLGYGFENPKPGAWRVRLRASERAPADGAPFALSAQVVGGAQLEVSLSDTLPAIGETVTLSATFDGEALEIETVRAHIRSAKGDVQSLSLEPAGNTYVASWQPEQRGLYGIDVIARSVTAEGLTVERTVSLSVEVRL